LGKRGGAEQAVGDGLEPALRESDAGVVDLVEESYQRSDAAPSHGSGPPQRGLNGTEQRAVPVIFQDSPTTFDAVFGLGGAGELDGRGLGGHVREVVTGLRDGGLVADHESRIDVLLGTAGRHCSCSARKSRRNQLGRPSSSSPVSH